MLQPFANLFSLRITSVASLLVVGAVQFGAVPSTAAQSAASPAIREKIVFVRADPSQGIRSTEYNPEVNHAGNITGVTAGPQFEPTSLAAVRRNEIGLMNPDGSGVTELHVFGSDPVLSPDGAKIAYCSQRETIYSEIYVMNVDGTSQQRLTNFKTIDACGPAWSHDGKKIAFYAFMLENPRRNPVIWIMDADGSNQKHVIDHGLDPVWSPDDRQIAFASNRDRIFQIYAMNADGSNVRVLSKQKGESSNPAWAPDGAAIAFSSESDGGHRALFIMGADGSQQHRLAYSKYQDFCFPSWSPDGKSLVYTALGRLGPQGIIVNEEKPRCEQWTGEYQIFSFDSEGRTHQISDTKLMGMHASYGRVLAAK
jgi:Tol biopolymer transport system component